MSRPHALNPSPMTTPAQLVSLFAIYRFCFVVGLFSFGGGLFSFGGGLTAWLRREIVQVRGWMTDDLFFSGYSLAQILPGVNSTNMAVYIGQHCAVRSDRRRRSPACSPARS
jgi:chromate transport protein ChrA